MYAKRLFSVALAPIQPTGGSSQQLETKLAIELIRWRTMIREAGIMAQ